MIMLVTKSQCLECKNFIDDKKFTCKAFPKGIPDELLFSRVSHREPYKGDNGIVWVQRKL